MIAPLDRFSPATREWFAGAFTAPTAAQAGAWEAISSGGHALVVAPTGSGKTLSAFLWSLDRLATTPAPEVRKHPTSPTIKGFTDQYGVKVTYESNIDGNDTFTTKYQPDLEAAKGIGADLIVLTSWMAAQYVENGWVEGTKMPSPSSPSCAPAAFDCCWTA